MMTAKEYLLRYKDAYRRIQAIELKITQIRLKYAMPSAIEYSDMPKAHNSEHDLSDYVAKVDSLVRDLYLQYGKCSGIEADILDRIWKMQDASEREVLIYRYTHITEAGNLTPWDQIAEQMHYSRMTVIRIHGRALQHFPMNDI